MIPGLDIDEHLEARIRAAFARWADHFKAAFFAKGLSWLVDRYAAVIGSLRTQSCPHGPNGTVRTGSDWQYCCGVSYEYHNDIAVRDALAVLFEVAPTGIPPADRARISELDDELYSLFPAHHPHGPRWWHDALPSGVVE